MADTPETDQAQFGTGRVSVDFARKLERERDAWKAKFIQQNKDLGCEMMDPNGTIWDYAKKLQSELSEVTKQKNIMLECLRELRNNERLSLGGAAYEIVEKVLNQPTNQND
jgi:hypothetical protein